MEPWQQEELRQLRMARRDSYRPRCQCCGQTVQTELQLDLSPFGLSAVACEGCVRKHMRENP